jgi:tetratricopeptide (TPR) repeat protein
MEFFPETKWDEISNQNEPDSLEDLFQLLFLDKHDGERIDLRLILEDSTPLYFFCNKLMSTPMKERPEALHKLLSYTLYVATLFVLKEEYHHSHTIIDWSNLYRLINIASEKGIDDSLFLYATVLCYFIKDKVSGLQEEEVGIFAEFTFERLNEKVHFGIEWDLFHDQWNAHMPLAEFFSWSFEVVGEHSVHIAERLDLPVEDILESYIVSFINVTKMMGIGESSKLDHALQKIYQVLPHPFLELSCELFKNDYSKSVNFKKYITKIKKDSLDTYGHLLKEYLNSILGVLIQGEDLLSFLQEVEKKKYLIPLLNFVSDSKYLTYNQVLKVLGQLGDKNGFTLALKIYEDWLNQDVQEKIKEDSFYLAYIYGENARTMEAVKLYKEIYEREPENTSIINNLALLYFDQLKEYDQALMLLKEGKRIDPEHKNISRNLELLEEKIKKEKQRPKEMKDRYFKKTDKLLRNIMFSIYKLSSDEIVTDELLQSVTKLKDRRFFQSKMNKLLELELVAHNQFQGYFLEPTIYQLVQEYVNPKIEREVVRASQNKFYRPIFYHESEIKLYQALIELFPQQLVFPNMDLKTIIDVDKVKPYLEPEILDYMFKAHVDFAIISNTTYLPILCIEKDSSYQDDSYGEQNALKKNMIFNTSGLPLIRIRFTSAMDNDRLKEEVKQVTKEFLLQTHKEDDNRDILKEFELKRFGIYVDLPPKEELDKAWKDIVGDMIFNETKDIKIDTINAVIQIQVSKNVEQVLEYGKEAMKANMYQRFPTLNSIQFNFI